jgi:hypothetical protein
MWSEGIPKPRRCSQIAGHAINRYDIMGLIIGVPLPRDFVILINELW